MTRRYIFLAAPYQGTGTHDHTSYFAIHANISRVHAMALALARLGYGFFAPHVHSAHNEVIAPDVPAAYWYELDLHFLHACDAVLRLPGDSRGADAECREAAKSGIPVYDTLETLVAECPPFS
jgi:nucleoside 2-deoxyribosyltransferase